jgi:hypothetical protein
VERIDPDELVRSRHEKFRRIGAFEDAAMPRRR